MIDPSDSDPEVSADIACKHALDALDDLMMLATRDETAPAVIANRIFVGQILVRAQLVASFLAARQPPSFRVISNGKA